MVDAFIRWYRESGKTPNFLNQVATFARFSVYVTRPGSHKATVVNVDGDDVPLDCETLADVLGLRVPSVTMAWWLSPSVDVVDTYAYEPLGCEVQTLWLDGLVSGECEVVLAAVTAATEEAATRTRALVADMRGLTDADEWDSVILHGGMEIPGPVEGLLLAPELAERVISHAEKLHGERVEKTNLTRIRAYR